MSKFYERSVSSPSSSIDKDGYGDSFNLRRKRDNFGSTKSISMATIQAQVSIAQSIRDMFQAARTNKSSTDGDESCMENAWLQAVYNSIVLLVVSVVIFVLIAVYYVLEPFLHPLLWAVLVGIFLYPFKRTATNHVEQWLTGLQRAHVPLAAGIVISPFALFNYLSLQFDYYLTIYLKPFLILLATVISLYIAVTFNMLYFLQEVLEVINIVFNYIDMAISFKWLFQVCMFLLVIGSVLYFVGSSDGPTGVIVKGVIVTLWYLVLSIIANICFGYIGLPLITVLFIASFLAWLIQSCARNDDMEYNNDPIDRIDKSFRDRRPSFFQQLNTNVLEHSLGIRPDFTESEEDEQDGPDVAVMTDNSSSSNVLDIDSLPFITITENEGNIEDDNLRKRGQAVQFAREPSVDIIQSSDSEHKHLSYGVDPYSPVEVQGILKTSAVDSSCTLALDTTCTSTELFTVTHIFLVLITTCMFVLLWRNLWLLVIIMPLVTWLVIKKYILNYFPSLSTGWNKFRQVSKYLFDTKKSMLCPKPIPILLQLCKRLDRNLLHVIKSSVSPIISGTIILALIIGGIGGCVFFVLQVQVELAYSVNMMKQVLNTSVAQSPWIHSIVGDGESINSSMVNSQLEQFADQGFHYGRDWLKGQVESLLNVSSDGDDIVVNQVLKLYDSFYHSYVIKNISKTCILDQASCIISHASTDDVTRDHDIEGLKEHLLHEAKNIVSDNMETIVTIMKTLWAFFSVNISIGLSLITSFSHIIFSGGTIIINMIVFITALFYLLVYSEDRYLPEKWIMNIVPGFIAQSSDVDYADSFTKIIRGVFDASFQRACFYGLYTWLVLSILGMEMTVVPSVLASVTGAIPFIGPYWVSVPAILEIWLIRDSPFLAILVIILFLIPPFTVDNTINKEIKGGHPYLTGLAIAGGLYFAGIEGAIFGPILLCCLLFLVDFLTSQL